MRKTIITFIAVLIVGIHLVHADVWVQTRKYTQPKILTESQWNDKKNEIVGDSSEKLIRRRAHFSEDCPYKPEEEFFTVEKKEGKYFYRHYIGITETDYWKMISYGS